ncbi:MAG: exodeoxyribonuclease VII large subunit [Candidatus Lambdaproteobacteria bacterium RIFOXYD1_FULL_56_27]|uniref:Exodeoxyribonuclease 7 large subunit n=1 Tax=Candidatus Lambdaproteobacteria bacterium RIFOXYD2_FULL_56_26 TaxID=1817773 RepID=A0A1F6GXA3_9PROT|nr:MAG: exodeoxyribonuclease VII large subunit [Candidatus Lambdaproteobacteria bacterium RIFOXYC1_FULL_56_13]OGH02803.1 MAG: exodeoxyribonuclease VII large subunit [Candidatus Lambdaproteobacteria bacterium RIFOXYD2_FULL_56_26]OGH08046.1 MAG: exodeoxyribonuclease VII large subunit [Candidatus Lambdaproteobacteria bacterium RIFOXYD1_FULL_56_27]
MADQPVYSVGQLTQELKRLLELRFAHLAVRGEISSLSRPGSGHQYFTLKDSQAQLSCAFFKNSAARCPFVLEEGMEVVLQGRISLYEPRGSYQLIVESVLPVGAGALQLAYEQLKAKLEAQGLFDLARKRPLPWLPKGIGIITSPTGAVIQDLLSILGRRCPSVPLLIYPSLVQGETAAASLKRGIEVMGQREELDLIILARGGGSFEDLWAFNDEALAQAIFRCPLPVVSAVGHETDFTIADFVADLRAPTPSAAAELVVPLEEEILARLKETERLLVRAVRRAVTGWRQRLEAQSKRLRNPAWVIEAQAQRVDDWTLRLKGALDQKILSQQHRLALLGERLEGHNPKAQLAHRTERLAGLEKRLALWAKTGVKAPLGKLAGLKDRLHLASPLSALRRGYAAAKDPQGRLLKSVTQTQVGQKIQLFLSDGQVRAEVLEVTAQKTALPPNGEK